MQQGSMKFFGDDYVASRDEARLTTLQGRIRHICADGKWRSIDELCRELRRRYPSIRFTDGSVSRLMRMLRREGATVERQYVGDGLYVYRVLGLAA